MDPLTPDERARLIAGLDDRHRELLRPGERFALTGKEEKHWVGALLALEGGAEGTRLELELRVEPKALGVDPDTAMHLCLDGLDLVLGEWLESGRSERFDSAWETRDLEGREMAFRGRLRRPALEAEASRLLGEPEEDEWVD